MKDDVDVISMEQFMELIKGNKRTAVVLNMYVSLEFNKVLRIRNHNATMANIMRHSVINYLRKHNDLHNDFLIGSMAINNALYLWKQPKKGEIK